MSGGRSGSFDIKGVRTRQRRLKVMMTSASDTEATILLDPRFQFSSPFLEPGDSDPNCRLQSVSCTQDSGNPKLWWVDCTWSTEATTSSGKTDEFSTEIDLGAKYSWDEYTEQEAIYYDFNGKPVTNSSGEMFDPPLTRTVSCPLLRCTRATQNFDPTNIMRYKDAINSAQWGPWPAFSAKCVELKAVQEVQKGVRLWRETSAFAFRLRSAPIKQGSGVAIRTQIRNGQVQIEKFDLPADTSGGWVHYELDRGLITRQLVPSSSTGSSYSSTGSTTFFKLGPQSRIYDPVSGQPVSSPVLLDGAAGVLIKDGSPLDLSKLQPVWLAFHLHPELNFSELPINPNPPA